MPSAAAVNGAASSAASISSSSEETVWSSPTIARRRPRPRGRVGGAPFGGGLGHQRIGLGLQVSDLGLELEAKDLAPDIGIRRREGAEICGRHAIVRVFAADP